MASFNPIQLITALEDLVSVFEELKSDGTFEKLVAAETAITTELASNAKLKDLLTKLEALK